MRMEVEQKFTTPDLERIRAKLDSWGAELAEERIEVDCYYRHPSRDFSATDEALRLRRVGHSHFITYKGPKIDATTKTRREIDLPLADLPPGSEGWDSLLEALGFSSVAEVVKRRRKAFVDWKGRRVEVSLDQVEDVGTFVELELVTDAEQVPAARECLATLAAALALSGNERRSYLELLLEHRRASPVEASGSGPSDIYERQSRWRKSIRKRTRKRTRTGRVDTRSGP